MRFRYRLSSHAERYIRRIERSRQTQIFQRIHDLCEDPYNSDISKLLHGEGGLRSSRVGSLRILYYVEQEIRVVDVTEIGPRGDIYRD